MSDIRWPLVRELFDAVVELPEAERAAHLERAGVGPDVRAEAERMLRSDAAASGFLESSSPLLERILLPQLGTHLGHYELKRVIASGGMGTVFEAVQDEPRRTVALKTLRLGFFSSPERVQRFRFEAEVLGQLRHPAIAQIFEAGTHEEAGEVVPFIAMELVPGARDLLSYAREEELDLPERLALFLEVCEAVQHGHQKGVIHRDLKPGNILVDSEGRAKVIDFGVARWTDPAAARLSDVATQTGQILGTFAYMAPEQLAGDSTAVDVRSDVYALGILLFELVEGRGPHELACKSPAEALRRIQEEVPRPSPDTPHDLRWILAKALAKEPERRYGSVIELAADLRHHLRHEPVLARPPSVRYRAGKFVRRHRFFLSATAAVIAALAIGLVRARRAERVARIEQERHGRVAAFLTDILSELDPIGMGKTLRADLLEEFRRQGSPAFGPDPTPRPDEFSLEAVNTIDMARHILDEEVLHKAVRKIESELREEPALAAELFHAIGSSYWSLQLFESAADSFARAAALNERARGADHELTIHLKGDIGDSYRRSGRFQGAEMIYREALEPSRRVLGEEARQTLLIMNALGDAVRFAGRDAEAESLHREALEKLTQTLGPNDEETLKAGNNLAAVFRDQGRLDEAEKLLRDTTEKMEQALGSEHPQTLHSQNQLAKVMLLSGRAAEAEALLDASLEKSRRTLGEEAFHTLAMRKNLADVYLAQERFEASETLMRDNLLELRRTLGGRHPHTMDQLQALGRMLVAGARADEAVPILLEALATCTADLGERHPQTLRASNALASAFERADRRGEAEDLFLATARTLGQGREKSLDAVYAEAAYHLGCLSAVRGDRPEALGWLQACVDAGFSAVDQLSSNTELDSLHGPEFDALLARAREN